MKKIFLLTALLSAIFCTTSFAAERVISLSNEEIKVDEEILSDSLFDVIYLTKEVETHDDVAKENEGIENKIVTIKEAGEYRITGTAENLQIRVDAAKDDEVSLILDNANITCKTAPAILIRTAKDDEISGDAGVKLVLENNNIINGSHVAEYYTEEGKKVKHDAAISARTSLVIEGTGTLDLTSDNEGIESKMHLTINGGNINISSKDDALNASEDFVSYITINGGSIYAIVDSDSGSEGDGIDSNGWIVINGGLVLAQAHSNSMDSGLDADNGIIINGGTVIATGNMYEGIDESSKQQFMQLYFSEKQKDEEIKVVNDKNDVILEFEPVNSYSILECSSPEMVNGTYYVYANDKKLSHLGVMENGMGGMRPPMDFQNGEFDMDKFGQDIPNREGVDFEGKFDRNFEGGVDGRFDRQSGEMRPTEMPSGDFKDFGNFGDKGGFSAGNPMGNISGGAEIRSYEFVLDEDTHVYQGVDDVEIDENAGLVDSELGENNKVIVPYVVIFIVGAVVVLAIVVLVKKKNK